ncbi:MAG: hypothetical protein Q8P41_08835 [Pseudomonadota bacterium]|nr:hypothetical protein [Pseudomonadota bacterium]
MLLLLLACTGAPVDTVDTDLPGDDTAPTEPEGPTAPYVVTVTVTLDGAPVADAIVKQGGGVGEWATDADGRAVVTVDPTVAGDQMVVAAHPRARVDGVDVEGPAEVTIALVSYDPSDNHDYVFADPGPESHEGTTTAQCSHCHVTIHHDWFASPHRTAASNPVLHDLYAGTAATLTGTACAEAGGTWGTAPEPGTGTAVERCLVGASVADTTDGTGACADCHAPGINGELGGRDLLEATGIAYDAGVHCDVCHHVSDIDLDAEPGVAGRLRIVRPSEPASSPLFGIYAPLVFGPLVDVLNPRMGSVHTPLFHEAKLCAGCHEQLQPVLVAGVEADAARWPDGRLPIHTTYTEWEASPMNPSAPCQSCHMPPDPNVGNAADLHNEFEDVMIGVGAGWERPPGTVRTHSWYGPRQPESNMLALAASLDVSTTLAEGTLTAAVTVANVGPGHAIPTGEPLRALILLVTATCDGLELAPTGGDVVPDYGGALATRTADEDWVEWPGAAVGDTLRVVQLTGAWHDYQGYGPFGDGRFSPEEKGLPVESLVGTATVLAVDGDRVTLDTPLPPGDRAYRTRGQAHAGAPGFAFARVLTGAEGTRMVPHFQAVDVASDNRLLPGATWTSTHTFAAPCAAPSVHATLLHRDYPLALATARGWTVTDQVMVEAEASGGMR